MFFIGWCELEPYEGYCRGGISRWYYDKDKQDCIIFGYSECGGNKNNFQSREQCLNTCLRKYF